MFYKFFFASSGVKILSAILPFVFIPIIVRSLGVESYAKYSLLAVCIATLLPAFCCNIQTYQRIKSAETSADRESYLYISLIAIFMLSASFSPIILYLNSLNHGFDLSKGEVAVVLAGTLSLAVVTSFETYISTGFKAKSTVHFSFIYQVVLWGTILVGVTIYSSPFSRALGFILFSFVLFLLYFNVVKRAYSDLHCRQAIREAFKGIKFAFPLATGSMLNLFLINFDKLVISANFEPEVAGYYFGISQLAMIVMLIFQSSMFAIEPLIYKLGRDRIYPLMSTLVLLAFGLAISIFYFRSLFFGFFLGTEKLPFDFEFAMLLAASFFKGITVLIVPLIISVGSQKKVPLYSGIVLVFYVIYQIYVAKLMLSEYVAIGVFISSVTLFFLMMSIFYSAVKKPST